MYVSYSSSTELSQSSFANHLTIPYRVSLNYLTYGCALTSCIVPGHGRSAGHRIQGSGTNYLTTCTCKIGADQDPRKPEPRLNKALHQNQDGRAACGPSCQVFRTHGGGFPIRWGLASPLGAHSVDDEKMFKEILNTQIHKT